MIAGERIKKLQEQGFHIEAVIIQAQVIEHIVKLVLYGYGSRRRMLKILGENDAFMDVKLDILEADDTPLGGLVGTLKKFVGNHEVIEQLGRLNTLRKGAVHKIFDGKKEVGPFEDEARAYTQSGAFECLQDKLQKVQQDLNKELEMFFNVHKE